VRLAGGPFLLDFDVHCARAVALEFLEGWVDLTQFRVPEVSDRGIEELLEFVAGHWSIVDEAEERVLERHQLTLPRRGSCWRVRSIYPSLFRLAATGRVWVTGDHGAEGAPVEVQRPVRKEISKSGPGRAAGDTQGALSGQCGALA